MKFTNIVFVAVILLAGIAQASKAPVCHNVTGTCLSHGFVCANEQVVKHSERCDGIEHCADGSDEFMCDHEDHSPLHERSEAHRHAFEQASCVKCRCGVATLTIGQSSAWYQFALASPTDPAGLMTGTAGFYPGQPCNSRCTQALVMTFYKKTGVCRGYLCCARQVACQTCFIGGSCPNPNTVNYRCYRG